MANTQIRIGIKIDVAQIIYAVTTAAWVIAKLLSLILFTTKNKTS